MGPLKGVGFFTFKWQFSGGSDEEGGYTRRNYASSPVGPPAGKTRIPHQKFATKRRPSAVQRSVKSSSISKPVRTEKPVNSPSCPPMLASSSGMSYFASVTQVSSNIVSILNLIVTPPRPLYKEITEIMQTYNIVDI